jgi:hypothetical protein
MHNTDEIIIWPISNNNPEYTQGICYHCGKDFVGLTIKDVIVTWEPCNDNTIELTEVTWHKKCFYEFTREKYARSEKP